MNPKLWLDPPDLSVWRPLIEAAHEAQRKAYAPYSKFAVGAAILCETERIIIGCNVENASFGATLCAERVAVHNAVSQGYRNFHACVIVTPTITPAAPCGLCRQVLVEFCIDLPIVLVSNHGAHTFVRLSELLPYAFRPESLSND